MVLRVIAGLGNPGQQYQMTRHNAGFWFIDELLRRYSGQLSLGSRFNATTGRIVVGGQDVSLICPHTFMNNSGQAIGEFLRYYKIEPLELLVVHDELDLDPGCARIKKGGGHGGHNGLRSIHQHLSTDRYYRLRVGIGHPGRPNLVTPHVLSAPPSDQRNRIEDALYRSADALQIWIEQGVEKAMAQLHTAC